MPDTPAEQRAPGPETRVFPTPFQTRSCGTTSTEFISA